MRRLHAGLPEDVLLVIDAAYSEYVTAKDYEAGIEMVVALPQCGDDPHLLQALWPGGSADRLDATHQPRCAM